MPELAKIGCCGSCFVLLVAIILFAACFSAIEPLSMGIKINYNVMSMDHTQTYGSGRRFIGIGKDFIRFPINYQTVQLGSSFDMESRDGSSVKCRSLDGLPIVVDVSISYKLSSDPADLVRLYRDVENQEGWHELYTRIAQGAVRDVTARYDAFAFFVYRSDISDDMKRSVNLAFSRMYATVEMFELTNMEFAGQFANAIEVTQVALQDVLQAQAERDVAVIDAESSLIVATKQAQVQLADASAEAAAVLNSALAEAATLLAETQAQVTGYLALKAKLDFNSTGQLLDYQFVTALEGQSAEHIMLNMPYPSLLDSTL